MGRRQATAERRPQVTRRVLYIMSRQQPEGVGSPMRGVLLTLCFVCLAAPARGQIDFSGEWSPIYHEDGPERGPGPELGDYTEMPINDAARMRADSWDADRISVVQEYQCRPHGADYA